MTIFLEPLQYVTTPDTITATISIQDYKGKIQAWDERTSTSPMSNMHLGHLKAYWAHHLLEEESARTLEQQRTAILEGHITLLNYALKFGYSYNVWKSVVNTMLEKDASTPKIH